ncbi:MAG: FtsX-like permease family protein, partial [Phycisphaerae bacterium]|nr:FtsX-like permease family protein [Phycisphaerae bacterium]
ASEAVVDALRAWRARFESSPQFAALLEDRKRLEQELFEAETAVRESLRGDTEASQRARGSVATADLDRIRSELGTLPVPASELQAALERREDARAALDRWIAVSRQLAAVREQLAAPEVLAGRLREAGVATTTEEIQSSRVQTRWVIGLALLVACVGILNAMLMSVTERFREIGTMKCLGALDGFIVKLFLLESLFQGGVGTLAGVVIGLGLCLSAAGWSFGSFAWQLMPWGKIAGISILCLLIGMVLTVAGALYPAWQAARMQPIAAMRVEV